MGKMVIAWVNVDPKNTHFHHFPNRFWQCENIYFLLLDFDDQIQPQEFQVEDTIRYMIHSDWVSDFSGDARNGTYLQWKFWTQCYAKTTATFHALIVSVVVVAAALHLFVSLWFTEYITLSVPLNTSEIYAFSFSPLHCVILDPKVMLYLEVAMLISFVDSNLEFTPRPWPSRPIAWFAAFLTWWNKYNILSREISRKAKK